MKRLSRTLGLFSLFFFLAASPAKAVEGFYFGGAVGAVGLTGNLANAIDNSMVFGVDLGMRINPIIDLMSQFQFSGHKGFADMKIFSGVLSADFRFLEFNDLEFSVGAGPGFYAFRFTPGGNETLFGLNFGGKVQLHIDENVRIGVGGKYHVVMSPTLADNYWTVMLNIGYLFGG